MKWKQKFGRKELKPNGITISAPTEGNGETKKVHRVAGVPEDSK
jgi:hypothetical protein